MKWIKYQIVQSTVGEEDILINKKVGYSNENLAIAQKEAYNGYEIVEDSKSFEKEPLPLEFGGTGAKNAEEARKNLGLDNIKTELTDLGVNASAAELNHMKGVTSGVQGQLDVLKKKDLRYGENYTDLFSPTLSVYHEAWNKWVIVQGANIANAPVSGTVWFEVFTGGNQSAPRGFQIAISCFSSSRSIYIRWLHDSTWSGWEAFMTTTGNQNPSSLASQGAKTSGGSWSISDTTLALYKYLTFAMKDGDGRISLTRVPIDLVSTTSTKYVLNPLFGNGGDTAKAWGDVTIVKSGTTVTITYNTRVQDSCTISNCTLYLER